MLYVFHGNDTAKAHDKAHALGSSLLIKKPDASLHTLDSETWTKDAFNSLLLGQGLFEQKYIVLLDTRSFLKESFEELFEKLPQVKDSPHIFIFLGGKLDVKSLKDLSKHAEKVQEYTKEEVREERDFRMTDALGERDKKRLWVLYQEALRKGREPEEIHGLLFWQIKNMLLASRSKNAEEAGMKAFPFSKAKQSLKHYSAEELNVLSSNMVTLYHHARAGKTDFTLGLEKLILSL